MRQFDVYTNPVVRMRAARPYILVLQHERVSFVEDIVVAPLGIGAARTTRLSPALPVLGAQYHLVTRNLTFMPLREITGAPIDNLAAYSNEITRALDYLFNAAG